MSSSGWLVGFEGGADGRSGLLVCGLGRCGIRGLELCALLNEELRVWGELTDSWQAPLKKRTHQHF